MAAQSLVIACSSTPQVVAGSIDSGGPFHGYIRVSLKAVTGSCYLGSSGVTTAGFPLSTGDGVHTAVLLTGETLYVASSSGSTATLGVLRLNETT
jgi:hypothetical protein